MNAEKDPVSCVNWVSFQALVRNLRTFPFCCVVRSSACNLDSSTLLSVNGGEGVHLSVRMGKNAVVFVVSFGIVYTACFVDKMKLFFTVLFWVVFTSCPTVPLSFFLLLYITAIYIIKTQTGVRILEQMPLDYSEVHDHAPNFAKVVSKSQRVSKKCLSLPFSVVYIFCDAHVYKYNTSCNIAV